MPTLSLCNTAAKQHLGRRAAPSPEPSAYQGMTTRRSSRKAAQRRARALEAAAIATDPILVGTVPSLHPWRLVHRITALDTRGGARQQPGVTAVRVNHCRNIVAADVATPAYFSELLTIKELSGVPVSVREPADRGGSVGFLHGVDGDFTDS
ncbi:hypothetical protein MRX96_040746 [Rhipicephalus microplus]